jgi:hypothetical protein
MRRRSRDLDIVDRPARLMAWDAIGIATAAVTVVTKTHILALYHVKTVRRDGFASTGFVPKEVLS